MVQQSNNTQGETVAGFHIIRELGRGNNGVVYLARQIALDRQVALKILLPELAAEDPTYIRNFLHEARLAARLDHPNIVQALDAGETPAGLYFFAMEFVDGKSLEDIRQQQPELISLRFLLEVSLQLADAMDYAWRSHKMTHGDIKPGNLLIRSSDGAVKLADLGLARVSGAAGNDEIMATPMYAAPEVIMGQNDKIGPCTDIYSFGVMFYELAAGTAPFHGNTEEMLRQHLEDEPTPLILSNPDIDPDISKFVARMLRKDPADRVSDWQEVRNFLESVRNKQLERARMTQRRLPAVAPARQPAAAAPPGIPLRLLPAASPDSGSAGDRDHGGADRVRLFRLHHDPGRDAGIRTRADPDGAGILRPAAGVPAGSSPAGAAGGHLKPRRQAAPFFAAAGTAAPGCGRTAAARAAAGGQAGKRVPRCG